MEDDTLHFPPTWVVKVSGEPRRVIAYTLVTSSSKIAVHPVILPPNLHPVAYIVQRFESGRLVEEATFNTLLEAQYLATEVLDYLS